MNCLSTKRPLFLSGEYRRKIMVRRAALVLSIVTLSAFAAGYFFGG